jgi:hypothetical protein
MSASNHNMEKLALVSWDWIEPSDLPLEATASPLQPQRQSSRISFDLLLPIRQWLDNLEVQHPALAHRICKLIPAQCPFERDVKLFGRTLFHIPPLCKLNPVYEQVVALRFRALCYLADVCGEDVSQYC